MSEGNIVVCGIDTHKATHDVVVLDKFGTVVAEGTFSADISGYEKIENLLKESGECVACGIEGTGSYGKRITRYLCEHGFSVCEILGPNKVKRAPGNDKDDRIDARRAAEQMLRGENMIIAKEGGWIDGLQTLLAAREALVAHRSSFIATLKSLLVTSPESLRDRFKDLDGKALLNAITHKHTFGNQVEDDILLSLKKLAKIIKGITVEVDELDERMSNHVRKNLPHLLSIVGCGVVSASVIACAVGGNVERIKSESALAKMFGVSPVLRASGKTSRHSLNRGGNRKANRALYTIAIYRMQHDACTQKYMEKKRSEGKSKREIRRCIMRYLVRKVYQALKADSKCDPESVPDIAKLKQIRKQMKLCQADIAEALGVPRARVSRLESNATFSLELLVAYKQYLDQINPNA